MIAKSKTLDDWAEPAVEPKAPEPVEPPAPAAPQAPTQKAIQPSDTPTCSAYEVCKRPDKARLRSCRIRKEPGLCFQQKSNQQGTGYDSKGRPRTPEVRAPPGPETEDEPDGEVEEEPEDEDESEGDEDED